MYLQELWQQVLTLVSSEVPKNKLLTYFSRTAILELKDGIMKVGAPTPMAHAWIANKCFQTLVKFAQAAAPETREVTIEVDGALLNQDDLRAIDITQVVAQEKRVRKVRNLNEVTIKDVGGQLTNGAVNTARNGSNGSVSAHGSAYGGNASFVSHMLNQKYSLNNFVVGKDNRLAHAACIAISRRPGSEYNPLFIYGGVGLGKTHLLQATGNEILKNHPDALVVYLTAERFLNEVVAAIKRGDTASLRNRYRKVDCLIIDDIQFFTRGERTQEEFFHTFNDLFDAQKQIIVSSDCPPRELDGMEDRLKSRFGSGMVVEVYPPDFETRLAILQQKCQQQSVILPPEIIECLAKNGLQSVRELEGFLTRILAGMKLTKMMPTIRTVAQMIKSQNGGSQVNGVSEEELQRVMKIRSGDDMITLVSRYYQIPIETLTGASRKKEILLPRQLCMYLMYEVLKYSYGTIGDYFHGRNHTTVLHAHHKIEGLLMQDQKIASDTLTLKREIGL